MKKRTIILTVFLLLSLLVRADRLMDIMQSYNPRTMSIEEMDSVLNGSETSRYRLEYENKQKLFRQSFFAEYYLVDTQKNTRLRLSDVPVRDPQISPNGKYVVYAKADNNLYIYKIDFKTEVAITTEENLEIFNGVSDWLYEEEFGVTALFAFSPDSKMVAFVRLNETDVPSFEWQTYFSNDIEAAPLTYPMLNSLRYPKAGEINATAEVCIYDIHYKSIRSIQTEQYKNGYFPRITWGTQPPVSKSNPQPFADLMILYLNRDQNQMNVIKANPKSTVCHTFYTEESREHFINYEWFDKWQWLSDGRVVVVSEKGGYVQAYLYSSQGIEQKLLTPEKRDITDVYGFCEPTQTLYYQAAPTPMTRHAYALNIRKNTTLQITKAEGTHQLMFSKDYSKYIDCFHSTTTPHIYTLINQKGGEQILLSNDSILKAWQALEVNEKEFFTIKTERGDLLNAWRILPKGFDASHKYPVVMLQYSGPTSQRVLNNWRKRFGYALADAGYLVVNVDGRGTGCRGREWRNATYMQLGVKEAEDQISAAKYLKTLPYVDGNRMAICGWSYGGYQTLMCLSKQQEMVWQCGIAIAPVTNWRLYDSAYTERFMRRPQVNEFGYEGTDLMKMAGDLTGNLLLVHGLADDNVHAQNTLLYTDALVKAGKQFEMQLYVDDNHSIRKPHNNEHLHHRIMLFLQNNL